MRLALASAVAAALLAAPISIAQDLVAAVAADDPEVNAARDRAREMLPYFWEAMEAGRPNEGGFSIKAALPTPDDSVEHIWVSDLVRADGSIEGLLANEPVNLPGLKLGQAVTFTEGQVTDWGFERDGLLIGHYTTRLLLEQASKEEAAYIRSILGEAP